MRKPSRRAPSACMRKQQTRDLQYIATMVHHMHSLISSLSRWQSLPGKYSERIARHQIPSGLVICPSHAIGNVQCLHAQAQLPMGVTHASVLRRYTSVMAFQQHFNSGLKNETQENNPLELHKEGLCCSVTSRHTSRRGINHPQTS